MCVSSSPRETDFGDVKAVKEVKRLDWLQSDDGKVPVS